MPRDPALPAPSRGRFITLEGGEGAGKSTQVQRLVQRLRERGYEAVATREPGGSPLAEAYRKVLLSGMAAPLGPAGEALLFSAARIDHLDTLIRPSLAAGTFVVSDRFSDSTRAYQGALGKLDPTLTRALERVTVGESMPDLTLILDLPAEVGMARAAKRRGEHAAADRFEREGADFHAALRRSFLAIAAAEPERCVVIDATETPEEVAEAIWQAVEARLFTPGEAPQREATA